MPIKYSEGTKVACAGLSNTVEFTGSLACSKMGWSFLSSFLYQPYLLAVATYFNIKIIHVELQCKQLALMVHTYKLRFKALFNMTYNNRYPSL